MKEKLEESIFIRDVDSSPKGSTLVVGIDNQGNISRFNKTLEDLTGSTKNDVINESFLSYFSRQIPSAELQKLLNQVRFNPDGVDVDTSFKTVHGENMVVSWTSFPIKNDENGKVSQLNLVGTPQKQYSVVASKPAQKKKTSSSSKKSMNTSTEEKKKLSDQTSNATDDNASSSQNTFLSQISMKPSDKKKNKNRTKSKKKQDKQTNKLSLKNKKLKKTDAKKRKKLKIKLNTKRRKTKKKKNQPSEIISSQDDTSKQDSEESTKQFSFKKRFLKLPHTKKEKKNKFSVKIPKISTLSKKERTSIHSNHNKEPDQKIGKSLQKIIKQLKNENKKLRKQNEKIEKKLKAAELKRTNLKNFFNIKLRFIRDSVGIEKKRDEFQQMIQQLSERKQKLEQLETDMIVEKKEFKHKIEEFITWREKLEKLESEIEKRRQFLSEQELFLNKQYDKVLAHELTQPATYIDQVEKQEDAPSEEDSTGLIEKENLFNSLTIEAAVLQRGRIKKINKLFADMLGFSEKDLVGKHLVDFVTPLGLEGVEQHYMNRLKGVDDATYQTVFQSKNNKEIPVKVHVKTADYNGERAEIATFNEI